MVRGPQKRHCGGQSLRFFCNSVCKIFGTFRVEATMKCLIGFLVILKRLILSDLEIPFSAKICFHCWFD